MDSLNKQTLNQIRHIMWKIKSYENIDTLPKEIDVRTLKLN